MFANLQDCSFAPPGSAFTVSKRLRCEWKVDGFFSMIYIYIYISGIVFDLSHCLDLFVGVKIMYYSLVYVSVLFLGCPWFE